MCVFSCNNFCNCFLLWKWDYFTVSTVLFLFHFEPDWVNQQKILSYFKKSFVHEMSKVLWQDLPPVKLIYACNKTCQEKISYLKECSGTMLRMPVSPAKQNIVHTNIISTFKVELNPSGNLGQTRLTVDRVEPWLDLHILCAQDAIIILGLWHLL